MNASFLLLAAFFPTPTSGIDHGVLPFKVLLLFEWDWIFPEESYEGVQKSALRAGSLQLQFKLLSKPSHQAHSFSASGHECYHFSALTWFMWLIEQPINHRVAMVLSGNYCLPSALITIYISLDHKLHYLSAGRPCHREQNWFLLQQHLPAIMQYKSGYQERYFPFLRNIILWAS